MWFWIAIGAGAWVATGAGALIQGCRKHGPVADAGTLLTCLLAGPVAWWLLRK